jgi:hypothetical protein
LLPIRLPTYPSAVSCHRERERERERERKTKNGLGISRIASDILYVKHPNTKATRRQYNNAIRMPHS